MVCGLIVAVIIGSTRGAPYQAELTPDAAEATHFLHQRLNRTGVLGQKGLTINRVLATGRIVNIARATYNRDIAKRTIRAEHRAFKTLRQAEIDPRDVAISGRQFVVRSFHEFGYYYNYCFIMSSGGEKSLKKYVAKMTLEEKVKHLSRLLKHVVKGVAYMHRIGIVHNDIKPENIAVNATYAAYPRAHILDMDLAASIPYTADAIIEKRGLVGTGLYMAPECYSEAAYNPHKKDAWAIGASFYAVLFGKPVVPAATQAELKRKMSALRTQGLAASTFEIDAEPEIEEELEELVKRIKALLAPRFEDRPTPNEYLETFRINAASIGTVQAQ
ncbi:kinase-like domain-containing protein [Syncephalis pseudoplumigaleata]|uniref:Kinase-like domain-containing protein n=1 Tax=Syncephalis pseudoplumigaleata TaxID=1712513 RepID=A0A4V1J286_9FUNG|nr:kinase-like domain-containing protein [Syncephalis pseudoplumigaleata]|eukprot:RKP27689.1 kinase-like domain-containing protein [Syncephalis pseudoplumigaleata]